jgi:aminoglycoside phosphotransferase (APT) family kinase protein
MSYQKMHDNEIHIDKQLVQQLLNAQFPQWASLPITPIQSAGTDNALYRLGNDMCIRLPRIPAAALYIKKEQQLLPQLAPRLPLAVPVLLSKGNPQDNYPWCWEVYRWLEGENAFLEPIVDLHQAAIDLALFLQALQQFDPANGQPSRRGLPLATQDLDVRKALAQLSGIIDTQAARKIWEECLQIAAWSKQPVLLHGDLLPTNLLVQDGRLSAVIDFDSLGIGDPACDLIVAWSLLTRESREVFRATLDVDDATWMRGKGWALSIALIIIPYYQHSNPVLTAIAHRMLNEILM